MEEKSRRGLSLRKKSSVKPKISAPRQISNPIITPLPSTAEHLPRLAERKSSNSLASRDRSQNRENTSADYVKRRYSTKVNQVPTDYFDAPAVPAVPDQFAHPPPRGARRLENSVLEKIAVDLKALQDPDLRSEQYVAQLLVNASEQDIREYQQELTRLRTRTSTDLQHNVYQNRNQFIRISQEAEKLKTEMRALRSLMSDLTNTLGQTNAALGISTDTASARKFANRSSVANLEAMWSTHLQELWRRVEGSQKYLPAIPGRHVVHESGRWVELNTATWKPRRRVHLILLNDHLLVATEKKRVDQSNTPENGKSSKSGPQSQFVAERCYPLQDIEISDLSARPGPVLKNKSPTLNAINVRVEMESFTYAVQESDSAEKISLLAKARKELANIRKSAQAETEDRLIGRPTSRPVSTNQRDSFRTTGMTHGATTETGTTNKSSPMLTDLEGKQQSFRWMESLVDKLDIDIALQRFEEAASGVDMLRKLAKNNVNNTAVQELVDEKVQERAATLAKALIRQLVETNSFMGATQQHVVWLTKLGFENRASEAFLEARSGVIRTRIAQVIDHGDLPEYLYSLSYITFTLILHTVQIHQACFASQLSSAVVKWAKEHVERFNDVLRVQTRKLDAKGVEKKACLDKARECAERLREVGYEFTGLVGKEFNGPGT